MTIGSLLNGVAPQSRLLCLRGIINLSSHEMSYALIYEYYKKLLTAITL